MKNYNYYDLSPSERDERADYEMTFEDDDYEEEEDDEES